MTFGLVLLLSIFGFGSGAADGWQCRNDLEISCVDGKCGSKSSGEMTPMDINFDEAGNISVCAYTGCWDGRGKISENGDFLILTGQNLKFSTSDSSRNVALTLDRNDNVGILKVGNFAQPVFCSRKNRSGNLPKFSDYKVAVSKAAPKPVRFAGNKDARMFRTRLTEANDNGVNFAGHFVFAIWGCGTSCVSGAVIDTKTGVVYFPEELGGMTFGGGFREISDEPLQYKPDSNLFILEGNAANNETAGRSYFVWEGAKFKRIKFVPFENQ